MYARPSDIIIDLESNNSRLYKEEVLERVMREDSNAATVFIRGAMRVFNNFETFGVRVAPKSYHENGDTVAKDYEMVNSLFDKLASRELSGNAARDAIEDVSLKVDDVDWNMFYSRVLLKNLDCGVNVTTWNKVAKKVDKRYMVDIFSCQLATDGAKQKAITGKKYAEIKLDGVRVISVVHPDGTVDMFSRNGKRLDNFPKIKETLSKYKLYDTAFVLDGEVMSSSFQDLMKQVHRKEDVQTDDAVLWLFDIISYRAFREGIDTAPQRVRSEILKNTIEKEDNVKVVQQIMIDFDTEEGRDLFKGVNKAAIDGGYEGIMLKDPEAPYETKRTKSWLKIKPVIEVTLEVVDFEQGTGKYSKTLGALVCRGTDTGREISVNVGSGLSDDVRDDIWLNKEKVLGMQVEVKADAITQNQDGTYSLRFPRFKCFRGFEPGEKL